MGYPQDALADDEELLLHHHPHWKMLVLPAVTFVLGSAVAGFAVGVISARLTGTVATVALLVVAALWVALVAWRSLGPLIEWKCTHFIVTGRRVLVRQGVLTHSGIDIPMGRISNVQFRHGLLDRVLGTGTLIIASAADDPLEFDDIPGVQRVHSLLYQQVFDSLDIERGQPHPFDDGGSDDGYTEDESDDAARPGWRGGRRG